jgi:glucose uptake protein GlcU
MGIIEIMIMMNDLKIIFDIKNKREKKRLVTLLISILMIIAGIVIIAIIQ